MLTITVVNADKESGRVTLITRYGAGKVRLSWLREDCEVLISEKIDNYLAGHIGAVQESGHPVVWICDPMHGKYVV